jgi:S1-C subfamily serine protease
MTCGLLISSLKKPKCFLVEAAFLLFAMIASCGPSSSADLPFSSVYEADRPSVVYIVSALPAGAASGSGFIYSSTGSTSTIITANHVVEGASRVDVILDSDPHQRYAATIVRRDHVRDVAVLTIPVGNRRALPLMDAIR